MERYALVKKVIDSWDPMSLFDMGCPDDEYEFEIRDTLKLLNKVGTVDELAVGIQKVFVKWFGEDLFDATEECKPVATEIWNKLLH